LILRNSVRPERIGMGARPRRISAFVSTSMNQSGKLGIELSSLWAAIQPVTRPAVPAIARLPDDKY
jgi:hypothetical protein